MTNETLKRAWAVAALGLSLVAAKLSWASPPEPSEVFMFSGQGGAWAYTIDKTGANLPPEYAPWKFRDVVSTRGRTFRAGADKKALKEVQARGYSISIISVSMEAPPPAR